MSASDDKTVRLWDLPSMESTTTFVGHGDYVRTGAWMPGQASGLVVSGSYDQTVRLWDPRVGGAGRAVMCFKHEAPVESVLPLPSGMMVLAAAENTISVLDLIGARPLELLRNHQKTITSLSLASGGSRVVSGGLDGHVKVYETMAWNVVCGFKYSSPVLALSVIASSAADGSREDRHLAVGLQSGVLNITTRLSGQQKALARERKKEMQALVEGRIEEYDRKRARQMGRSSKKKNNRGKGWEKRLRGWDYMGEEADIVIDGNARGKIRNRSKWETALRKGQYEKALDIVLGGGFVSSVNILTIITITIMLIMPIIIPTCSSQKTLIKICLLIINYFVRKDPPRHPHPPYRPGPPLRPAHRPRQPHRGDPPADPPLPHPHPPEPALRRPDRTGRVAHLGSVRASDGPLARRGRSCEAAVWRCQAECGGGAGGVCERGHVGAFDGGMMGM